VQKKESEAAKPEKVFKIASVIALLNGLVLNVSLVCTVFSLANINLIKWLGG
jgi:hypothetical protein